MGGERQGRWREEVSAGMKREAERETWHGVEEEARERQRRVTMTSPEREEQG